MSDAHGAVDIKDTSYKRCALVPHYSCQRTFAGQDMFAFWAATCAAVESAELNHWALRALGKGNIPAAGSKRGP